MRTAWWLTLAACGGTSTTGATDAGIDATADAPALDASPALADATTLDAGPSGPAGSLRFVKNAARAHEYAQLEALPPGFGAGELTLELWVRLDDSFPVGPVSGGDDQLTNWSSVDNQPYSSGSWWYAGNFLLDGHNNADFAAGTFSLQLYGGGRLRWLFGDGTTAGPGGHYSVGAYPAAGTPSLLDGAWHHVACVRRFVEPSGARLELYIDGGLVDSETTTARTDMRAWWDAWAGFPAGQEGWFWGSEKQAAIGFLDQYEDYKGLVAEVRFWTVALSPPFAEPAGTEAGLGGWFRFGEGSGAAACDALAPSRCMALYRSPPWSADTPP